MENLTAPLRVTVGDIAIIIPKGLYLADDESESVILTYRVLRAKDNPLPIAASRSCWCFCDLYDSSRH